MHPYEFLNSKDVTFSAVDLPIDISPEVKAELSDLHPSMFITTKIAFACLFKVSYSYTTPRGNYREHYKIVMKQRCDSLYEDSIMIESIFMNYVSDYNRANPYKKMENVKILSVDAIGICNLNIG